METVREQGFVVECGPDSWVTEKPWARELAVELGLAGEVMPSNDARKRTYLVRDNALLPFPDGMRMMVPVDWEPLLTSPLLSPSAKLAYQQEPERAAALKQQALLAQNTDSDESVAAFVRRHFGEEAASTLAGPLLAGVFGGDIERLSVRAVMAPFVRMEAEHGSLIVALQQRGAAYQGATFTTLRPGLGALTDALAARLEHAMVLLHTPVTGLGWDGQQWTVLTARGACRFDAVVLATSVDPTRRLLRSLGLQRAERTATLLPEEASSSIVVAFGFAPEQCRTIKVPPGFGFLVPPQTDAAGDGEAPPALLACTFVNQKFAHRAPGGAVLLRGFFGGRAAERLGTQSDAAISDVAHAQLSALLGPLPRPQLTVVRRWPQSLPQYHVGHLRRMQELQRCTEQLPGLTLLGNAYRGVGLPDLVRDARAAVRRITCGR